MVKKFVSLLLCVILALGALPLSAGAAKNPGDSHTITFHYENPDGTQATTPLIFTVGDTYQSKLTVEGDGNHLPPHTGHDKTFLGWYNAEQQATSNNSLHYINLDDPCSGAYDNLYAWYINKLTNQNAIIYDYNIEDNTDSFTKPAQQFKVINNGDPVGELPVAELDYGRIRTFAGWWFYDVPTSKEYRIGETFVPPGHGLTIPLRAKWINSSSAVTLTLTANGGTFPNGKDDATLILDSSLSSKTYAQYFAEVPPGTDPYTPTREGYTFAGWYLDSTGTNGMEIDLNHGRPSNTLKKQEFFAKWEANTTPPQTVKLTLTGNGGTYNAGDSTLQMDVPKGSNLWDFLSNDPSKNQYAPTRTGYTFAGWYLDVDCKNPLQKTDVINSETTLFAKWVNNSSLVTLTIDKGNSSGGKFTYQGVDKGDNFNINVASGTTFGNALKDVTATNTDSGLILKGWSTSSTGYVPVDLTAPINSSQTIYAVWGTAITVSVNPNGGTYDGSALPKSINIPSGTTFADFKANYLKQELLKPDNSALREFSSWYLRDEMYPNDATKFQILKDNDEFNQDITIHAAWKAVTTPPADEIIVSFDLNYTGAPAGPADIKIGDTLKYGQLPQVTRAGYNFLGWFAEKSGGTEAKTNGSLVKQESHTLYAHWGQMGSINLNPDGGTLADGEPKSVTPVDGKYPELPDPTRAGYTFQGWFTAQKDSGVRVKEGDAVSPADIGMIYAHWKANTYTVAYDLNYTGAPAAPTDKTVTYDQKYGPLAQPDRSGYTFLGWFTQPSGGLEVKAEDTVQITQKQTLFAHWQEGDPVTLELQGGKLPDGVSGRIGVTPGGKYPTLPVPTRTGYTFEGWFTKAEDGSQVESGDSVGEKAPEKLYAHWTARKVTVNFDYNGAPGSRDPRTYNYGAKYTNLPASARWDGHTFLGWFTAATGGTQITKDSTVSVPEGTDETEGLSITLYAHWGFQISYEANGGSGEMESSTAPMDSPFTLPSCTFTPPYGMVFDRWAVGSLKGEHLTAGATHTFNRNTTLYATWKESPVTITATCTSGGSLITTTGQSNTVTVDKGQDVTFNATANYGYELVDLIVDGESLYALESYTFRSVMENHTIHAVFQRIAPDDYITCPRDYTCPLSRFSDLNPREWYHDAVHYCLDEVIMNGVSSNRYGPNMPTSRAMLTMALWRAEGRPDAVGGGALTRPYKDVPSTEWFYRCIVWATRTGVVNGYSATAFGPNDNITREQVVTILWRHAGSPAPRSYNLPFYDDWATSSYAWNAMCWAYENGIIKGRPNRILDPRGNAKRVEIAEIMKNYLLNYSKRT